MTPDQFWSHVDRSSGPHACWPWLGARKDAYGSYGRNDRAHRQAYRLAIGPIPADRPYICHTCNNPLCCNPAHLVAGTHADNMRYMAASGRSRNTIASPDLRAQIVTWYGRGLATAPELAALIGVTPQRIRHIYTESHHATA